MTTQSITELEERLAAILTDGITVGAQVYSAPGSFFDADVKPYIVTAVTDPTIRPGLFPGEASVLGGGTVTAHPVGDPTTVVTACTARLRRQSVANEGPCAHAPRPRIYQQRPVHPGGTGCAAVVDEQEFELLPKLCGWLAAGPHPDPERSYREPLCKRHLDEEEARRG